MLISKHHLKTRFTASTDSSRPILNVIQLSTDGSDIVAAATDGYVLSEVRERVPVDDEYPATDGVVGVAEARIHAKTANAISSSMKTNKLVPVLSYAQVSNMGISTTDLERTFEFKDAQVEGNFPDYKPLIPKAEDAKATVKINPAYLATMAKLMKDEGSITLEIHGDLSPVVFRSDSNTGRVITGIVMPLKS